MIIVSMGAGLGNQMFEYAFYTHLSVLYPNEIIKVDTRYAFPVAHNGIEVFDIFGLHAETATLEEVMSLTNGYGLNGESFACDTVIKKIVRRIKRKLFAVPETMRIQADYTEYYEEFQKISKDQSFYYYGPFANYHYFSDIEHTIRDIYRFPEITDELNHRYMHEIENSNSVSIHLRKGDYVREGVELTSPEFYKNAMQLIESKEKDIKYFVFTDDAAYAHSLFPDSDQFVIVTGNSGKNSFRDMQLMSLCKHNITANSTFSFWGAFLNRNPNKIVIAPNLPFTGGKFPFVCDDWILL